jgi:adenylate cyclase
VARHVEDHGGMINSFIGDAIMGVFGAPITHSDEAAITRDAVNAVECALAMERTLRELNEEWPRRGLPTTEMRVGIFTGPVVTGSLGTAERVDYVVFGDSVNTAARLESAGKEAGGPDMPQSPCTICIGDSTFQRLGGKFRTIPLGALSLKGKQEKIIVHRLVGPAASDTPL